jgi:hypothetical protein
MCTISAVAIFAACPSRGAGSRPITLQFLICPTWGSQNDVQRRPPSAVLVAEERPKGITSRVIIVTLVKRVIVRHPVPTISRPARPVGEHAREPGKIGKRQIVLVSRHHNGQSAWWHTVPPDLSPRSSTARLVEQENARICCNVVFVAKIQRHGIFVSVLIRWPTAPHEAAGIKCRAAKFLCSFPIGGGVVGGRRCMTCGECFAVD